jgi:tRNA-dihydrouridine synthase B
MRKFWDNLVGAGEAAPSASLRVGSARAEQRPVPLSVRLGDVTISPATVLAPMAGVTDTVFRRFIRNLGGCGLIMTEFTSADGVLRARDKKAKRYLHFYEDEHPISAQLFGSDPQVMADAARIVEDLGFDLVDLNLGCPAKKVVKCNGGSGLLRDLPAIGKIFEAVRAAVSIPFTVKFRAGWNDEEIICVELARMAEACGLCAVALHARTREQGYSGQARWDWIAAVKNAVKIPVIGNGDIRTPEDACAMIAQTGCDAVMIGRTAPSNPWIFRQIAQYNKRVTSGHVGADALVRPASNSHVGTAALGCPVERSSTGGIEAEAGMLRGGHNFTTREKTPTGGGFGKGTSSVVPISLLSSAALVAECADCGATDKLATSGAKADSYPADIGTLRLAALPQGRLKTEAVLFAIDSGLETSQHTKLYDEPSEADRYQMIRTYFQMLIEEEMPGAEGKMKQFASWFTHGVPGGAALRKAIYESKSAPQILSKVEEFFGGRLEPCGAGVLAREG